MTWPSNSCGYSLCFWLGTGCPAPGSSRFVSVSSRKIPGLYVKHGYGRCNPRPLPYVICSYKPFIPLYLVLTHSVGPTPEGSSPHSQQPANGPYPEPGESTPPPPPISLRSILIPSSPSTPLSSKWYFSFEFSHPNSVHVSPLSHACHMPCSAPSWFDLPNNIWSWVQIMKLPVM
jgi:hypothetical protein